MKEPIPLTANRARAPSPIFFPILMGYVLFIT
jgi:hypothetical protein